MMPALGFATATGAEARFVLGCRHWTHMGGRMVWRSHTRHGVDLFAVRSGVGAESTLSAARWLVQEGVTALACLGVAGGLRPGLRPGEMVIGETVVEEEGTGKGPGAWDADPSAVQLVYTVLSAHGIKAWRGRVVSTRAAVLSAEDKISLYRKSRALAVDMESSAVARTATESDLPFLALRAVCDPQERTLDRDLTACLDQGGRIQFPVLLKSLLRGPSLVFDLLPVARDFVLAISALRRAWQVLLKNNLPLMLAGRSINGDA
jgi:adenosylhomocysteine nucleosidase